MPAPPSPDALLDERLKSVSDDEFRAIALEAVRRYALPTLERDEIATINLRSWYQVLLQDLGVPQDDATLAALESPRKYGNVSRSHRMALTFWSWMERAGYAIRYQLDRSIRWAWVMTPPGEQILRGDDPCGPHALHRLRYAFGELEKDSIARMEDARECFELGLNRPAIVLLGLAFEELMKRLAKRLEVPDSAMRDATSVQNGVTKALRGLPKTYARQRAEEAIPIASSVREWRNEAAHKASTTFEHADVQALFANAFVAYPHLAGYGRDLLAQAPE